MALPSQDLNGISLCTGGGGLDLGLELALPAARSVVMVEREAFSVAHLVAAIEQGLLAPAALWSDVRTFDGRPWRGVVDFLIGGIPCQPHSLAGKKRGSLDERDLWSPTRRIIVQARPWFGIIENVRGMLSAGADEVAGAERVLRDLRKLGYAVECGLFTAAEVGASHLRPRLFILFVADPHGDAFGRHDRAGSLQGASRAAEGTAQRSHGQRGRAGLGDGRQDVADADDARPQGRRRRDPSSRRQSPERHAGLGSGAMANASRHGRGEDGRAVPGTAGGRAAAGRIAGAGAQLVEPDDGRQQGNIWRAVPQKLPSQRSEPVLADADILELRREPSAREQQVDERHLAPGLFPPRPSDFDAWRDVLARAPSLEPSLRRMADGMAPELGSRVDELRMLGNGVVSLEGAYAFRTLVTRLASTGHAGAAQLAMMMEAAE